MAPTKVILIACGSFNPPTNMHLRMFEIARDHLHRLGNHVVIGGLVSPVHDGYGKKELEASTHRINMLKLALQNTDWIKLSDWECKQESWSRTRQVLHYHQNLVNAVLHPTKNSYDKINEDDVPWVPDSVKSFCGESVQVKLLCGADLLESFGTPGLWNDDDIEAIVGHHGLVVITRSNTNPNEFIYNSDVLTKYMSNIMIVTEWITNEVSSTKIRKALRRSESVKYLIPDKVVDYIHKHNLYGSKAAKYIMPEFNSNFLTPSPSIQMDPPSPTNCMIICNNTLFSKGYDKRLSIDTVDSFPRTNVRHPGQAVKVITESTGGHKIVKENQAEKKVCNDVKKTLKNSKTCATINNALDKPSVRTSISDIDLKETNPQENNVKFIFTTNGVEIISDLETII